MSFPQAYSLQSRCTANELCGRETDMQNNEPAKAFRAPRLPESCRLFEKSPSRIMGSGPHRLWGTPVLEYSLEMTEK